MIKGFISSSLSDWDGKVSAVIFMGCCNFRCPFCFNKSLVLDFDNTKDIPLEDVLAKLRSEKHFIDGVCITGGEPTLSKELATIIEAVKEVGLPIKLDTNGSNPELLKELIGKKIIDYVAMDIKSSKDKYDEAAGTNININKIEKSIKAIMVSGIDYEFRTTICRRFFSKGILSDICSWLNGAKKYALQPVDTRCGFMDDSLKKEKPFTNEEMAEFEEMAKPFFKNVIIRQP